MNYGISSSLAALIVMVTAWGCDQTQTNTSGRPTTAADRPSDLSHAVGQSRPDATGNDENHSDWIEAADRDPTYLDFEVMDQSGNSMPLSSLTGKSTAISFIFTRCPRSDMCPLIVKTMARLQRLIEKAGIESNVRLLLISYDPAYDTPKRLRQYGEQRGLKFTNAKMLRPSPRDTHELLMELDIAVVPNSDGTFGHFIELVLLDHKGAIASNTRGGIWDNRKTLEDLKELLLEANSDITAATGD